MTALEIIEAVEDIGGRLTFNGEKVSCRLPEGVSRNLLAELRDRRHDVAWLLHLREGEYVGKDDCCRTHGRHKEWYKHPGDGPDRVCGKCHPAGARTLLRAGKVAVSVTENSGSCNRYTS